HIDRATRFGYVLGYYPSTQATDGRFRRIIVRVNRKGLTVLHRSGYFGRPSVESSGDILTYVRVASTAQYPAEVSDIGVRATASMEPGSPADPATHVDLTIDPSRLTFTARDGRNTGAIDVAVFLLDERDQSVGQAWRTFDLVFTD